MKRILSLVLMAAMLFSMTTLFVSAEESSITLNTLASVSVNVGEFDTIEIGGEIFANRTYTFGENIPEYLIGKTYLKTNLADTVNATVTSDGYVYVITQVDGASDSQEASLAADGFTRIDTIAAYTLWSAHKVESAVMAKEVKAGDTFSFGKWGVLVADKEKEGFELNNLATVMPTYETYGTIAVGAQIFTDRDTHLFAETTPEYLIGKSYLSCSVAEGATFSVTADGWVYVITPVEGKATSVVSELEAFGFETEMSIHAKTLATTISEPLVMMSKEAKAGENISFGRWGIVVANIDSNYALGGLSMTPPTVIYNPTEGEYIDGNRHWQGIPSMTRDPESGRLWATWYSGGEGEGAYNFALLYTSIDDGRTWTGPVIAVDHEYPVRVFDPNLWMDPDGRMWMFWSQSRFHKDGVYGTWMMYTDNPESANPTWSTPVRVANGVTMNDPVVLSNGDWLLPTAIWAYANTVPEMAKETNSNVYISKDKGMTWNYLSSVPSYEGSRNCDENMIIEQKDGSLRMFIRTGLGIEESYSYDGGATWTGAVDAHISSVASRFYLTRLSSGNQLLIFNDPPENGTKRSHMTAALSTDDGKTWSHKLIIDERSSTTYPDAVEDADGNIYIIYDHGRGEHGEILMAKITEEDIIAGEIISETSRLKVLINNNIVQKLVGDIDGDGNVTIKDALDLIRVILNDETIANGDINGDGKVSLTDIVRVLKLITR